MKIYKQLLALKSESAMLHNLLLILRPAWLCAKNILGVIYGPVMVMIFVSVIYTIETQVSASRREPFENGSLYSLLGFLFTLVVIHSCIISVYSYKFLAHQLSKLIPHTSTKA